MTSKETISPQGFWSRQKLKERHEADQLILVPFTDTDPKTQAPALDDNRFDPAGYRLTMGPECYVSPSNEKDKTSVRSLKEREAFYIPSGQFAFLLTEEVVKVPANALAFIALRSGAKMKGLVNVSGFHADPGYYGRLIFSVYNAGPGDIHMRRGEELFMIMFADLDDTALPPRARGIENLSIPMTLIQPIAGKFLSLKGLEDSITDLEDDVKERIGSIEREVAVLRWAAAVVLSLLVAIFLKMYAKGQ